MRQPGRGPPARLTPRARRSPNRPALPKASPPIGGWHGAQRGTEQADLDQLVDARQIVERRQVEMVEEGRRGHPGHRPARALPPALRLHPAGLEQQVERALADAHAAHLLDLRAGHRLVVGDDRQGLERGTRQTPRLNLLALQVAGEIRRGAQSVAIAVALEPDAATGIVLHQLVEQLAGVKGARQMGLDRRQIEGLLGGEQQRLDDPPGELAVHRRRRR